MQRLIKDASQMIDIQKELGITVDASSLSFDNIVNAISVMQKKLDIAGTTAREATTTLQGSLNMLRASWDNILVALSDSDADLTEVFDSFLDSAKSVASNLFPIVQKALSSISRMVSQALPKLIDMVGDFAVQAIPDLIKIAGQVVAQIAMSIPKIFESVVKAIINVFDSLGKQFPELSGIFNDLKRIIKSLDDFVKKVAKTISEKFSEILPKLLSAIGKIVEAFSNLIEKIFSNESAMRMLDTAINLAVGTISFLSDVLSGLMGWIGDNTELVMGLVTSFIMLKGAIAAYNIIMGVWKTITTAATVVQAALNAVMAANPIGLIITAVAALVAALVYLWNNCDGFRKFIQNFFKIVSAGWNAFVEMLKTGLVKIAEFFVNAWINIKEIFNPANIGKFFLSVWQAIQNAFKGVTDWFAKVFSDAWQAICNVFSVTGQMFGNIGRAILNGISTVINGVIWGINQVIKVPFDGLNGILRAIKNINIFGLKPFTWIGEIGVPQIPSIPMLAEGGVLKRGQIALLEGQGDEAVIPLSQNTEWIDKVADRLKESGGNNTYNIHVEVENMQANNKEEIDALAEILMQAITEKTARRRAAF